MPTVKRRPTRRCRGRAASQLLLQLARQRIRPPRKDETLSAVSREAFHHGVGLQFLSNECIRGPLYLFSRYHFIPNGGRFSTRRRRQWQTVDVGRRLQSLTLSECNCDLTSIDSYAGDKYLAPMLLAPRRFVATAQAYPAGRVLRQIGRLTDGRYTWPAPIVFPVGGTPKKVPRCVPRMVNLAATLSPSATISSNVH